jgi:hypothetical protein
MTFKRSEERRFDEKSAKFKYYCAECGHEAFANHNELSATREVEGRSLEVKGLGLGTWRCPIHGKCRVERKKK